MLTNRHLSLFSFLCFANQSAFANTINFDGLADMQVVGSNFQGLTFSDTLALQAGISLNGLEFPPHSGDIAVTNTAGSLTIKFDDLITNFNAYFTYSNPLSIFAYDSNSMLIGSIQSTYNNNLALSGDTGSHPNDLLSFSADEIKSILVSSSGATSFAFLMDDVSYTSAPPPISSVPLPNSFVLILSTFAILSFAVRFKPKYRINKVLRPQYMIAHNIY